MSTFDRMLSVLNASVAAAVERVALGSATPIHQGFRADVATGRGCRRGKRRRGGSSRLSSESLERRQVMDISGFYTSASGGRAVLSLQGGDHLYVQQVATVPQSLIYADNSSFLNYKVIPDIQNLENLYISSGRSQTDVGVNPDLYPRYPTASANAEKIVTQFTMTHQPVYDIGSGSIVLVQADNTTSRWEYRNGRITSGPGFFGDTLRNSGYAKPDTVNSIARAEGGTGIAVTWSKPSLPSTPRLENTQYTWDREDSVLVDAQPWSEGLIQATAARSVVLTLPSAGGANSGINPNSFDGTLTIDGLKYKAVARDLSPAEIQEQVRTGRRINTLVFTSLQGISDGQGVEQIQLPGRVGELYVYEDEFVSRRASGQLDLDNGQVLLEFSTDPGPVLLDATYSVWETDSKPASVTFFAGLDITNQVTVDLLPPGSTINVDSPIVVRRFNADSPTVVRPSLVNGDVSLWATNVNMNARVQANDRLNVGWTPIYDGWNKGGSPPWIPTGRLSSVSLAEATGRTSSGSVRSIAVVNGGSGYSYLQPPIVTISAPQPVAGTASIKSLRDGIVTGITVDPGNKGSGYTPAPDVIIDPPTGVGGVTAAALAQVTPWDDKNGGGEIRRVDLDPTLAPNAGGGFGYTFAPGVRFAPSANQNTKATVVAAKATASIVGSIDEIFLETAGLGYLPGNPVTLEFQYADGRRIEDGSGPGVVAPVIQITADINGVLDSRSIAVVNPGRRIPTTARIVIPNPPPADPADPDYTKKYVTAVATAAVDKVTGRISAITVLNPGLGYGALPTITIEPPAPTYDAQRPTATATGGTVAGVTFEKGQGLSIIVNDVRDNDTGILTEWTIVDKGTGYRAGDVVALRKYGEPQAAYFEVLSVDALSGAQALKLVGGGSKFLYSDTLSDFSGTAGEGFSAQIGPTGSTPRVTTVNKGSGYKVGDIVTIQVTSETKPAEFDPAYLRIDSLEDAAIGSVKDVSLQSEPAGGVPSGTYIHATGRGMSAYIRQVDGFGRVRQEDSLAITVPGDGYRVDDIVELSLGDQDQSTKPLFIRVTTVSYTDPRTGPTTTALRNFAGGINGFVLVDGGSGYRAGTVVVNRKPTAGYGFQISAPVQALGETESRISSRGFGYRLGDLLEMQAVPTGALNELPRKYLRVSNVGSTGEVLETIPSVQSFTAGDTNWFNVFARPAGYGYRAAPTLSIDNPFDPVGTPAKATGYIDALGRVIGAYMSDRGSVYRPDDGTSKVLTVGVIATGVQQRSSVENCTFNAEIGADIYDMTIADDPATEKPSRSQLLVSSTGSLSQRVGTRLPATSVVVRSFQGDVRVEGSVSAQDQSYLLQSRRRDQLEGPYQFSTTSQRSGSKNGLISGGVVSITLGNDLDTPDLPDRVAYNDVTLNTDIRSLRIRAATRQGNPLAYPFPYEASISEANSLDVDAVAASSFPLSFQTAGSLRFNAVLETAGDVNLRTFGELSVAAPISTSLGVLSLEAESNVKVGSSLQVTKAIEDKARDDIFIRANAGNIQLDNGLIKAVNGVRLVQANTVSRYASTASTPLTVGTVAAPTVTTSSITINETVAASDINVKMSVTHPAVGALRATLIAPNKTRYRLLSNVGGGDKNFAGTIFDTEAPLSITEGSAPFSGSYRPIDSLASLNGQSLRGVWTLEVTNTGAAGAIDLFELNASTSKSTDAPGTISGTGLVSADRLSLVASGSVGDPAALPQAGNYSLRTQVNTVTGRAGGSVALWEKDALEVNSLRAPGPVTIRTDGYDQFIESAWQPTLRGDLIDATKVTLSAPNGSINMRVNTPDTIYFGNIGTISIPVSAQLASQYGMQAAGSVTFRSSGGATKGDVVVLDAPDAGGNARKVRSLIQVDADKAWSAKEWTYSKGVAGKVASTITGTKLGSLLPKAKVGDRVLVKQARKEKPADELSHDYAGVYSVTSIANGEIKLTRASDSDTKDEMQSGTIVAHADPDSGVVSYYRFRIADLAQDFGAPPIRVTPEIISSNIGSDDPTDQTRFVVSTSDGTNSRAGSFGKMLALIQANLPASGSLADVDELLPILQFSSSIVGSIQLDQELPFITKPLAINGNNRYPIPGTTAVNTGIVIDGYDILFDRNGNAVTSASVINGLSYQLPEQATEVSSLTNLSIGGFQQGAAIKVDSDAKSGVLSIDKVNVGLDANSNRLSNKVGVLITGTSSGVSLTNSNLASSTAAAIHIAGAAANTKLTGNMIGFSTLDNVYGIAVTSTGTNSIGLAGGGRNTIQYSQTGIGLFSGTTTVVNNDIARNIFDGIRIMGGKNTIGFESKSKALTTDSNSIYGNSRFGINVITKAFVDRTKQGIDPIFGRYVGVQLPQTISLNYLGVANFGKLLSVNTRGNIAVDGVRVTPATGRAYIPTSAAGRDLSNNQHGKTTVPVVKTPRTPAVPSKPATPVTSVNPVTPSKAVAIPPAKATTKFPWRKR